MKNRVTIKAEARELIRNGHISPILVSLIVLVVVKVLDFLSALSEYGTMTIEDLQYTITSGDMRLLLESMLPTSPMQPFLPILVSLLTTVLYAGYYSYCMGIYRREEMQLSSLADGLGIIGQLIWCEILMGIKVFLWSLLFFFPGIIAAYRYRFAVYNLLSDPSLSASQAIALSCRQTNGMKFDLFVLDLSFIGWSILTALTLGILSVWTLPYTTLSDLGYYNEAQQKITHTPHSDEETTPPWVL
ncbi:MAG: DUF975 family protein [Oscillospiraceae bacterium]|nr:DUF975 family protein [Oscillospiraceae bacterium]